MNWVGIIMGGMVLIGILFIIWIKVESDRMLKGGKKK